MIGGPVGTREYVSRLLGDGYGSHIRDEVDVNVAPEYAVLQDGSDVELAGYRVQSHAVVHSTGPSLAYRLTDADGRLDRVLRRQRDMRWAPPVDRGVRPLRLRVHRLGRPDPGRTSVARRGGRADDRESGERRFLLSHLAERRHLPGALVAHDLLSLEISSAAT